MDTSEKKRRPYPTVAQKAKLVSYLKNDENLSNGKYSSSFSKYEAEKRWSDIADELNAIPGAVKTWIEWRKTWQDMKCSSKRRKAPKKAQNVTETPVLMDEDLSTNLDDDSSTSHEDKQPAPEDQVVSDSGPKLMIELEGNGSTVSVSCTKKDAIPVTAAVKPRNYCKSTFLNSRRYTYDYFSNDNLCRLCWSTTNVTKSMDNDLVMAHKILDYVGVDVVTESPKKVCLMCLIKIETFIRFKKLCQEADRKLKIMLSSSHVCRANSHATRNIKREKETLKREAETFVHDIKLEKASSDFDDDDFPNDLDDNYCSTCNVSFDSTEETRKHNLEVHKNEISSECYGCNKTFNHKLKLCKDTMEYCCTNCCKCAPIKRADPLKLTKCEEKRVKQYTCHICAEVFTVHLLWRKHMAVHKKELKYVCETCGRVLKNKKGLSEHMLIHTNNKQLQCPHCDYRATLKTSLVYHIRLHTGERPYACDRCPYTCVTSSNLRRHINTTHLGIRAFKCQICSKEYMYKRSLKEHITSAHQGKKENMCKRCGALYFRFEHLRKHILVKHRKVVRKVKDDYVEVNDAGYKRMSKFKLINQNDS